MEIKKEPVDDEEQEEEEQSMEDLQEELRRQIMLRELEAQRENENRNRKRQNDEEPQPGPSKIQRPLFQLPPIEFQYEAPYSPPPLTPCQFITPNLLPPPFGPINPWHGNIPRHWIPQQPVMPFLAPPYFLNSSAMQIVNYFPTPHTSPNEAFIPSDQEEEEQSSDELVIVEEHEEEEQEVRDQGEQEQEENNSSCDEVPAPVAIIEISSSSEEEPETYTRLEVLSHVASMMLVMLVAKENEQQQ